MFISPAYAQAAGGASLTAQLLPFVLIFGIFYLFLIRPQQKRAKAHRELVNNVKRGDKIVTSGGLRGTIAKAVADQDYVEVEIAKDVKVELVRSMIATVEPKDK
ncbi:MAG: preprotein translocase subunit YajC [Candidatus Puniceispirillaceae bacterium]